MALPSEGEVPGSPSYVTLKTPYKRLGFTAIARLTLMTCHPGGPLTGRPVVLAVVLIIFTVKCLFLCLFHFQREEDRLFILSSQVF